MADLSLDDTRIGGDLFKRHVGRFGRVCSDGGDEIALAGYYVLDDLIRGVVRAACPGRAQRRRRSRRRRVLRVRVPRKGTLKNLPLDNRIGV